VNGGNGGHTDERLASVLHSADLWLTEEAVAGFESADFDSWPKRDRDRLEKEVAAFLEQAKQVPSNKPATKAQSKQARKHLTAVIDIVQRHLLDEWLHSLNELVGEAMEAAKNKGWHVIQDEKEVAEGLLGTYLAPRLLIRTGRREIVLDPVGRFVVDLVVLPTFDTAYVIMLKNGSWHIVARHGKFHSRPFSQEAFVSTITRLPPV
jgi:hypothetical protein